MHSIDTWEVLLHVLLRVGARQPLLPYGGTVARRALGVQLGAPACETQKKKTIRGPGG